MFARHRNVTAGLLSQGERGDKRASLKLVALVANNGLAGVYDNL